jgi:hypothetical protein
MKRCRELRKACLISSSAGFIETVPDACPQLGDDTGVDRQDNQYFFSSDNEMIDEEVYRSTASFLE